MAKATLIRDGALKIERCNQQGGSFPHICNNDKCQRSGRYRMSIATWPAGDYCEKCMKGMTQAWDQNLGREVADREAAAISTDASRLKAAA